MIPLLPWMTFLFVAGLIIGSFLALVSVRLPAGQTIVLDRSRCPHCGRPLAPYDLIPVLSYFVLRGRCRWCRQPIFKRYVVIELAAGAIGLIAGAALPGLYGVAAAVLGWTILILSILDGEHFWLPDLLTIPLILAGLALTWLTDPLDLIHHVAGAFAGYLSFAVVRLSYRHLKRREGLGGGDGKLFAASGAWLGWQYLPFVLLLSTVVALLAVLAVLVAQRTKSYGWTSALPFGPFLGLSTWCFYLVQPLLEAGKGLWLPAAFG